MDKKTREPIFGSKVRGKIARGVEITARAVATTLGSKGRNVTIEKSWGAPIVIHDGVTVAKHVVLKDPFENMGAQLVLHAAQNTNDAAGDGTTTATILTNGIVQEGIKLVASGVNPMTIRKGIEKAVKIAVASLKASAKPIKKAEEMVQVATISAADASLGSLIAGAIEKVGADGVVTVQEGRKAEIEVEYKEGMEVDTGFISPFMMTNRDRLEAEIAGGSEADWPYIVIINEKLNNEKLITVLDPIFRANMSGQVLLIADDFEEDAVASLVLNRVQRGIKIIGVKSPEFGDHRRNHLEDIAILTGGKLLGGPSGIPIKSTEIKLEYIGRAERILSTKDQTIIVSGKGDRGEIEARVAALRKGMAEAETEFIKDKVEKRIAKLVGGVAVINVGAHSEAEMRELKERVIDAVNAVKAAVAEGVVPGGGVALLHAAAAIDSADLTKEERFGADIVSQALQYPIKKLVENAGVNSGKVLGHLEQSGDPNLGYNVDTESYENMLASGIIDPVKVTRSALENAASIAAMLLTTDVMIAYDTAPEKKEEIDLDGIGEMGE